MMSYVMVTQSHITKNIVKDSRTITLFYILIAYNIYIAFKCQA